MKISINSVNFLEFFASFLYDTGKLFRFEKSRHFRSKKREVFIRKYVYLYERLIFSAAFVAGTLCIARKKGLEVMNLIQTNSLSDLFIHLGDIEGGESYINSVVEWDSWYNRPV